MPRKVDSERMWKVYDRIRDTVLLEQETGELLAEGWNQAHWALREVGEGVVCRTTFCFAGWTSVLAGDELLFDPPCRCPECRRLGYESTTDRVRSSETGRVRELCLRAQDLLGLTPGQADRLFSGKYSTLEELETRVRSLAGDRPEE